MPFVVGQLVIAPDEPALGVLRVVSLHGGCLRLLSYADGTLHERDAAACAPCPPGQAVKPQGAGP